MENQNVKVLSSTSIQCVLHPGYNYRVETFQLPAMNGRRSAIESELMPEAWRTDAPVRSAGACVCTLKIKSTHRRMRESMVAFPHSAPPKSVCQPSAVRICTCMQASSLTAKPVKADTIGAASRSAATTLRICVFQYHTMYTPT